MRLSSCLLPLLIITITAGPVYSHPTYSTKDTSKLSCLENAARLLDEALRIMQKNYYKKDSVRWETLITAARLRLSTASGCNEANETIAWCFQQMQETHSFVMPPAKAAMYNYDTASLHLKPALDRFMGAIKTGLLDDQIGYLSVPWVTTTDPQLCTRIADSIQGQIALLDQQGVSKWIIDLRENTGGNCWPMLAGLGPLLGNTTCGYFVSDSRKTAIGYRDGAAMCGDYVRCKVTGQGYQLKPGEKWIVVLTGPKTSSSGELVALAFKGRSNTSLYGEPTAGFTTVNNTYTLSDKSMLVLTVCRQADRTGKVYEGKIQPDEKITAGAEAGQYDVVKTRAVMWLQMQ